MISNLFLTLIASLKGYEILTATLKKEVVRNPFIFQGNGRSPESDKRKCINVEGQKNRKTKGGVWGLSALLIGPLPN